MRVVTEQEFAAKARHLFTSVKDFIRPRAVTGPGRSGAIAAVYASYMLKIPFLPYGVKCPLNLRPLLIIDTARYSGATLRRAERRYATRNQNDAVVAWVLDEPPVVKFWYQEVVNGQKDR